MKKLAFLPLLLLLFTSCISTRNTIKNIDDSAPDPKVFGDRFVVTEISTDPKYGYDADYPVNVFYKTSNNETLNAERYLRALTGPNGEKLFFRKVDSCCPFPSTRSDMGAGFVDIYEVKWVGQKKKVLLYINIYAKGVIKAPVGFGVKS
ncbi:2-dehydro-3-deoxyphosphooctonate aldolase [Flavobacterium selenitireducens]|uniref:2-dehydro-3-deoxyphosphooctonate aldolase n=1 Tax=Flavobacterium selenitireducens TaxID=2722704 RepID=UPI00168BB730|nr:2-dehydro-3-deoxyphosphooctonate aldolase [Flavobacterium selenitireducens]MBD3582913.1 2-dehydro-3-deoxyphosphooctonate aldolase [Flavobacterium selenitireducens]